MSPNSMDPQTIVLPFAKISIRENGTSLTKSNCEERSMYPHYDPEGQLQAYNYIVKRLQEEQNAGVGFVGTLIAAVVAMAITPIALWAISTGLGLGPVL